jgi:pullulanase/glycogen debranching enzyme
MRSLAAIRRTHPSFRRRAYLREEDATWLRPFRAGDVRGSVPPVAGVMKGDDWTDPRIAALGLHLVGATGDGEPDVDALDDDFVILLNASAEPATFRLPNRSEAWVLLLDTATSAAPNGGNKLSSFVATIEARSLVLLASRAADRR